MSNIEQHDSLTRFIAAQAGCYERVLKELRNGRKETHWMWFIFPQLAGLGRSSTARLYALENVVEARAYSNHALLGNRLKECCGLVLTHKHLTMADIFGYPDDMKLRSSMTLFEQANPHVPVFAEVLDTCFNGQRDDLTLALLAAQKSSGA